ncbi:MAG: hypothetical protein A2W35_14670 [Chloroflexi bacterium RBG_16_57_11]|nr:MAG: hypothetical protein A2W35_14670 [Chloroflexi bacterium RBG_16_57_11]
MSADNNQPVRVLRPSGGELQPELKPIVLNYKKWKKKGNNKAKEGKPKYSKGLEDIQRLEGDMVRVTQTGARALSRSIDAYEEERRQSAKKKTDGAIEDFIHNSAKATGTYLKEASDIPVDLADSVSRLSFRKNLRKGLRRASKRILTWPI